MTDDLTAAMAEAIRRTREFQATAAFGLPDAEAIRLASTAWARIALDAIIAQGGVTDDAIGDAILEGDRGRYVWAEAYYEPDGIVAVRDLMARAISTACAERDAEIERLRGRRGPDNEAWHEGRKRGSDEAHAAHRATTDAALARAERAEAERDELRAEVERLRVVVAETEGMARKAYHESSAAKAQVQRVRELADTIDGELDVIASAYQAISTEPRVTSRIRAALDGEADR